MRTSSKHAPNANHAARRPRACACAVHGKRPFGATSRRYAVAGPRLLLAAAVVICSAVPALAVAPAGNWWDVAYAHRRVSTVSAGASSVPAGTVAALTFDHAAMVAGGLARADGNDLRLAYWSGSAWSELSRTLAGGSAWNTGTTRILFKTAAQIGGGGSDDNYYLYFGRPAAPAPTVSVPSARIHKTEQLTEQGTASTTFVDIPGTTLTFTPGDASETWLVFASGVMRSNMTTENANQMQLVINGAAVDLWSHQNIDAGVPNGAGFLTFDRITGVTGTQTVNLQHRATAGTTYAGSLRVVAALLPPGADFQFTETDALTQQTGANLTFETLAFTPPGAGNYLIFGKLSHHETPGGSTVQSWLEDDAEGLHPNAPAGTRMSNARAAWQPMFVCFRRNLPATPRTFRLRGTSSAMGVEASEWRYRRMMALRTDAWETAEYSESLDLSTTTSAAFQTKNALTTAVPPGPRDYLVVQMERIAGNSSSTTARKAGELRAGGAAMVRTDHRMNRDGTADQGYHHIIGVADVRRTSSSVTYANGYLSPSGITVEAAESTLTALRYHEPSSTLGTQESAPTVAFTATAQNAAEPGGTVTVNVQLSAAGPQDVTVPFTVSGTASHPADYTFAAGPVTIPAGSTTASLTVSIQDDFLNDDDETVIVSMGTPTNALPGATTVHTITILDDEPPGVTVAESAGSTSVTESGGADSYTLVLQSQPLASVTITVSTDGKTTASPTSLTFTTSDWNTPQAVTVAAVNDLVARGVRSSELTHTAASADNDYNNLAIPPVTATVNDDDVAGILRVESGGTTVISEGGVTDTYTLALSSEPLADVTVVPSADGQCTVSPATLTFTATNWNAPRTVTVTAVNDSTAEGAHQATVTHTTISADPSYNAITVSSVQAAISDNDVAGVILSESGGATAVTEGGAADTYTVVLTSRPLGDVTVTVDPDAQTDAGAGAGSPLQLTFTQDNWNAAQTVTLTATNDDIAEAPQTSSIAHSVTSADSLYDGISAASVTATVTDNDTAGVVITQSGGTTAITEGGVTDTYTIVLQSQPTANVTVTVSADGESTVFPTTHLFTAASWNIPRTITVTAVDDSVAEGAHNSAVTHSAASADSFYSALPAATVTAAVTDNDTPGVILTQSGGSTAVTEGGATDSYTLVLQSQPLANVTITADPDGQADLGAGTGSPVAYTFTPANWNLPQTVTVSAANDAIAEGVHSAGITHSVASADPGYQGLTAAGVTAGITDNDIAYVNFAQASQSGDENAGAMTVTLELTAISTQNVTIPFAAGGTASNPADYTLTASPVTILAGSTTATLTIAVQDDAINDESETVILTLGNPTNGAKGTVTVHTATIIDNEPPGVTISESGGATAVSEGGASDVYTVALQSQPLAPVTVTLTTDGRATVSPTTLTFTDANWNVPQPVSVTAHDDLVAEGLHSSAISHALSSTDGDYNGITAPQVTATITDNDFAGATVTATGGSTTVVEGGAGDTCTLVLNSEPTASVVITLGLDGQMDAGSGANTPVQLVFTPLDWNVPRTVTLSAVDDFVAEGVHAGVLTLSVASTDGFYNVLTLPPITATIIDNDSAGVIISETAGTAIAEAGASDTYTLTLNSRPKASVVVTVRPDAQADAGAGAGNPVPFTFAPAAWNVPQTVTVTAVDDTVAEGNHTGVVAHTVASTDPFYSGLSAGSVAASITDNDTAGIMLTESGGGTSVTEGGATDSYTLVLTSTPTADVVITAGPAARANLGAGAGGAVQLTFTPANWNTPQIITVAAVDDRIAQGTQSAAIAHAVASADNFYQALTPSGVTASINDNDTAGVQISEAGGGTSLSEAGLGDTFSIELTSQPTADVVVHIAADAQVAAGTTALTFTPANWDIAQIVTLTAVNDNVVEGTHSGALTHSVTSGDPAYNGITVASVTATIADNDVATVNFAGIAQSGPESGGPLLLAVQLSNPCTQDVTVPYSVAGTAASPGDYLLPAGPIIIPAGQLSASLVLTPVDDAVRENDETVVISLGVPVNALRGPDHTLTATIRDDEAPGVLIVESDGSTRTQEGGAVDSYAVVLGSQPVADVTVVIATDGQTSASPTALTFTPADWSTPQTVTVAATDDAVREMTHLSTIAHTALSADPDYGGADVGSVLAAVEDNDTAGVLLIRPTGAIVLPEAGAAAECYRIALRSRPGADVYVALVPDPPLDLGRGVGEPLLMTFTPSNWNLAQPVTARAVDDETAQGGRVAVIHHQVISTDPDYSARAVPEVHIDILDDDFVLDNWPGDNPGLPPGLTVSVEPDEAGHVEATLLGVCGAGHLYVLTAYAEQGFAFVTWEGAQAGPDNRLTLCLTGPTHLVARFGRTEDIGHWDRVAITETTRYGVCGAAGALPLLMTLAGATLLRSAARRTPARGSRLTSGAASGYWLNKSLSRPPRMGRRPWLDGFL